MMLGWIIHSNIVQPTKYIVFSLAKRLLTVVLMALFRFYWDFHNMQKNIHDGHTYHFRNNKYRNGKNNTKHSKFSISVWIWLHESIIVVSSFVSSEQTNALWEKNIWFTSCWTSLNRYVRWCAFQIKKESTVHIRRRHRKDLFLEKLNFLPIRQYALCNLDTSN